jgi:hypothetical protein
MSSSTKFWLIKAITFISAFLLFQIEFIIGKIFLPNFGGSYLVWGACVVFFQAALLAGYLYAHYAVSLIGIPRYRFFHCIFVCTPLLFFPGKPLSMHGFSFDLPLVIGIFLNLMLTIGPAFFVLSTMSIIWQAWLAQSTLPESKNPYALFAVSNLGSFLALLSYPFVVEFYCDLNWQQNIWRLSYLLMVILQFFAWKLVGIEKKEVRRHKDKTDIDRSVIYKWLLYGAAGVIVFLAATNILTAEIAPIPVLWMMPLAIYLFSFVLNFKKRPWCPNWVTKGFYFIIAFSILFYFVSILRILPIIISLTLLLIFTFLLCMICQNRLYALKPVDTRSLTFFYLMISLGGLAGGLAATWIIPLISSVHLEYFLALLCLGLAYQISEWKKFHILKSSFLILCLLALLFFGPKIILKIKWAGLVVMILLFGTIYYNLRNQRIGLTLSIVAIILSINYTDPIWANEHYILSHRNYYGITRIFERNGVRFLSHDSTVHGAEYLNQKEKIIPLTYYHPQSPCAQLLGYDKSLKNIAVIGLGTGALATYLNPDQHIDFFELDPDILGIAKKYFTYLARATARVNYIIGDARISLENMEKQNYQMIIVDAFNGHSIPVHLITKEAILSYRNQLDPNGVIIFHVTNRYMDIKRPLIKTVFDSGAYATYKDDVDIYTGSFGSEWVAATWDKYQYKKLISGFNWRPVEKEYVASIRAWTDFYSTIIPFIKLENLVKN